MKGFTLIELLASAVIVAIALIPISRAVLGLMESEAISERMTKVAMLARAKMEEVKRIAAADFGLDLSSSGSFPPPNGSYRYTVRDDGDPVMKTISVTVWFDEDGDGRLDDEEISLELITRFTRRD